VINKAIPATVNAIEYDPNRSAFIALLFYADGEKRYILAPEGLEVGSKVISGKDALPELGNALFLKNIPLGTIIHNIELSPGKGGQLARSAGSAVQLAAKEGKYAIIKLPSGEIRMVFTDMSGNYWNSFKFRPQFTGIWKSRKKKMVRSQTKSERGSDESGGSPNGGGRR